MKKNHYSMVSILWRVWKCKTLLVMRLTLLICLFFALQSIAIETFSQNKRLSINKKDIRIEDIIQLIENETDYYFMYSAKTVDVERTVDIEAANKLVTEILEDIFKGTEIVYKIDGRLIALTKNSEILPTNQQQKSVSGKVTDSTGAPLPGVSVVVKGSTTGVITDKDGKYILSSFPVSATLQFSFVGMKTQEIVVGGKSLINVIMVEESVGIDEVVAIGYGTQKKMNLTAAVSSIKSDEILSTTQTSIAGRLEGKISGLQIRQNSGQPGSFDATINVRGFGTPLYIIDGIQSDASEFQRLTADDIENISVLKDGSAAIYGLNAGNGVVLVTTKRGVSGKTKFQYNGTFSFNSPTDMPKMCNAYQWATLRNDAAVNVGSAPIYTTDELEKWRVGAPGYQSTDWYNETMKKNAMSQQHVFSAEGGNEKVSYYTSLGYLYEDGLLKSNDMGYKQYSGRVNLTAHMTKQLTLNFDISGRYDVTNSPAWDFFSIMRGVVALQPIHQPFANNNPDYPAYAFDGQAWNPVATSNSSLSGYNDTTNKSFQSNASLTYEVPFVKGLQVKGVAAYRSGNGFNKTLLKSFSMYTYDATNDNYIPFVYGFPTKLNHTWNDANMLQFQTQVNYKKTISEKHNIAVTAVYEQRQSWSEIDGLGREFQYYTLDQINFGDTKNITNSGMAYQEGYRSLVDRLTYDYMGKYMLEIGSRYDGSYRYSPDHRWGFFPFVSCGWRVSEEKFLKENIGAISNLKLRGSYGLVGENAGSPFQYIGGFSLNQGGYEFSDGIRTTAVGAPGVVNNNLTWYTSKIKDFGFDLGLFDGSVNMAFDVYQRDRSGLLATRAATLPNTFGASMPQENLNKDLTRGLDFSINYVKHVTKDLEINVSANFNYGRTMNVYVESGPFTNSMDRWKNGQNRRWNDVIWMYDKIGQFQSKEEILAAPLQDGTLGNRLELPGDFRYRDVNNDGVINTSDLVPKAYNSTPKMHYGLTLGAKWKNLDFNMLWQGSALYSQYFTNVYATYLWNDANMPAYFMDRWHLSDPNDPNSAWIPGTWPAIRRQVDMGSMYNLSSAWLRDASYVRLKSLEIGYTVSMHKLIPMGIHNLRVYASGYNLLTICDPFLKAFDPERTEGRDNTGFVYPLNKSFSFGVNIIF